MTKQLTLAEVAKHKSGEDGMYIVIDNVVYDVASTSRVLQIFLLVGQRHNQAAS